MSNKKKNIILVYLEQVGIFIFVKLIVLISYTWRIKIKDNDKLKELKQLDNLNDNLIFAFWHQKMFPVWYYLPKLFPNKVAALVSKSKDGQILSNILSHWGVEVVSGSSSKGGREALEILQSKIKTKHILITPDGPRGPIFQFKPGALVISARESKKIVLVGVKIVEHFTFTKSWDKFQFPFPFAKVIIDFEIIDNIKSDEKVIIDYNIEILNRLLNKINDF